MRLRRQTATLTTLGLVATAFLAVSSEPRDGVVWAGGPPPPAFGDGPAVRDYVETGAAGEPADPPAAADPGTAEPPPACDWDRPPRPDSEIDIPDIEGYLVELEDGTFLLPDEQVDVAGHRLSLAMLEDILAIAEAEGMPVEEAILRIGWQEQFTAVANELQRRYQDSFAGAAIIDRGCSARFVFRGEVPDDAAALVESIPVPVALVAEEGVAEYELVNALHEAFFPIAEHPAIAAASGVPDHATGEITIEAQPAGTTSTADRQRLCDQLRPAAPDDPAITITFVLVEDLSQPASRIHRCR